MNEDSYMAGEEDYLGSASPCFIKDTTLEKETFPTRDHRSTACQTPSEWEESVPPQGGKHGAPGRTPPLERALMGRAVRALIIYLF